MIKGALKIVMHDPTSAAIDEDKHMNKEDEKYFEKLMCTWRDNLLNKESMADELVVNTPTFDPSFPEDDNIYAFSGYVNPAADHWVCIYDPVT